MMIHKNEIIKTLDALANWQGSLSLTDKERVALTFAVEYIKNGAERPHGEWLTSVLGEWRCSRCKKKPYNQRTQENFCPNCGSDNRPKEGE